MSAWPRREMLLFIGIVAAAGVLRLHHSGDLSLWLDEGLTVYHARRPWPEVIGLEGAYVENPPLYYALAKGLALAVPEVYAGRLVSVIAGTATVAVVYVLVRGLLDARAGLVAAALLAVSPIHIWYSQEARQYATAVLAVALAYITLFAVLRTRQRRWAAAYTVCLWLAMYLDYSALYALAAHVPILLIAWSRDRRGALLATTGALVAALVYLPWVPEVTQTIAAVARERTYLDVSLPRLWSSALSIVGFHGLGSYFFAPEPVLTTWLRWPPLRPLLVAASISVVGIGLTALARRSAESAVAIAGLLFGTIVVAVAVTVLVSPGYADRTVLYAAVAWVAVCAAALSMVTTALPRPIARKSLVLPAISLLSVTAIAGASLHTTLQVQATADKQHWRELAADVGRVASLGYPVVLYPGAAMSTFVDLYRPGAVVGRPSHVDGERPVTAALLASAGRGGAVWYAYYPFTVFEERIAELEALGYERIMHRYHWHPLYLDLFVLPGQPPGQAIEVNGVLAGSGQEVDGWQLPRVGATVEEPAAGPRAVVLERPGADPQRLARSVAGDASLYRLSFEIRVSPGAEVAGASLTCASASGQATDGQPDGSGAVEVPADGAWHPWTVAVLCPHGTGSVGIALEDAAGAPVAYRSIALHRVALP